MPDISVDLPSEIRPGGWFEWSTFDSLEEAIRVLRQHGIHVDDDGKLQIINVLPCMYCDSTEHGTDECKEA